ncbi:hypothetical protein K457DRAFT_357206 [Linnemannia elongata AG-77]|uniref:Uncharacterized protein n=1 Tax=Linnemannia elongata AG-77 TaxID=1314771 RepID=A0A197JB33_9FUNG|nr:hypothetical protein K457DRAFT_357206 [Linnemannia elongata AG-77]
MSVFNGGEEKDDMWGEGGTRIIVLIVLIRFLTPLFLLSKTHFLFAFFFHNLFYTHKLISLLPSPTVVNTVSLSFPRNRGAGPRVENHGSTATTNAYTPPPPLSQ